MLAVLDGDSLLVRDQFEFLSLLAREIVVQGNPGLLLDVAPSHLVGVKYQLLVGVAIDLYEHVNYFGGCFHSRSPFERSLLVSQVLPRVIFVEITPYVKQPDIDM